MSAPSNYADKEARLFVQYSATDEWVYLGLAANTATISIDALGITAGQVASRLDSLTKLHRRCMWPRWAALFTLIVAGVAYVTS